MVAVVVVESWLFLRRRSWTMESVLLVADPGQ